MEEVIAMRQKRISVEIDVPITPEPSDTDDSSDREEEDEKDGFDDDSDEEQEESGNDEEDDDDLSSHDEYVPTSYKRRPGVSNGAVNGDSKRILSPRASNAVRAEDDDDSKDSSQSGGKGPTVLNGSIDRKVLKFMLDGGISLSEQREALKKFKTLKRERDRLKLSHKDTAAPPSSSSSSSSGSGVAAVSGRRISVQNESAPSIRNKDSPPDPLLPTAAGSVVIPLQKSRLPTAARNKAVEMWVTSSNRSAPAPIRPPLKRLSFVEEEKTFGFKVKAEQPEVDPYEFNDDDEPVTVMPTSPPKPIRVKQQKAKKSLPPPRRLPARAKRPTSSDAPEATAAKKFKGKTGGKHRAKNTTSKPQKDADADVFAVPAPPPPKKAATGATASKRSKGKAGLRSSGHGTRSLDKWKWNEVIFSNPEKMFRAGGGARK